MTKEVATFPSAIAAKIARVKLSTLDNWNRREILSPSGVGAAPPHPRRYTFQDLVALRVLVALRDAGIDLGGLQRVVEYVRKRKGVSATEALAGTVLVTDGHDVYEQVDGAISISALKKPGQAVFLVPLGRLVNEVQRDARALSAA